MTEKRKILVVDDNKELRMLISLTLEFSQCELLEADSAVSGLEMLRTTPTGYHPAGCDDAG